MEVVDDRAGDERCVSEGGSPPLPDCLGGWRRNARPGGEVAERMLPDRAPRRKAASNQRERVVDVARDDKCPLIRLDSLHNCLTLDVARAELLEPKEREVVAV